MLLLLQLPTLLQRLLLLAMHNTAKATHRAMAWLMAMGQVEATHKEVLISVPTLKGAPQHHFVTLQDTLAMVTTVLLSQLVSRLLLMAPMSSKVILLVPIPRLSELTKRASIFKMDESLPPVAVVEQWKNSSALSECFHEIGLLQTLLSVHVTPSKCLVSLRLTPIERQVSLHSSF